MRTLFLYPVHQQELIGRNRLSYDLNRRKGLRTHNFPSGRVKKDFSEVDEAMFQGVGRPIELILFFLDMKKRMNEVTYMMFNVHEWA
jgi:uncharacterized protein YcgL (UPF0745 family)